MSTESSVAERLAAAPTVSAQLEIRGLAPLLSAAERIAAPALPAFAEAYGPALSDSAAGYFKLVPVARIILRGARARIGRLDSDNDFLGDLPPRRRAFLDDENLSDLTLAGTERTLPGTTRSVTTVGIPLADLHARLDLLSP